MRRQLRARRSQRGGALVVTAVSLTSLSVLSLSLLSVMLASSNQQRTQREKLRAEYVCEAALQRAVLSLNTGGDGAIANPQAPEAWGDSQFWVTSAAPGADIRTLTATALDDRIGARIELTLEREIDALWRFAAFGKDGLTMDSNARVDSYETSAGTYASQALNGSGSDLHAAENGDIGSNGSILMDSNTKVWGDANSGPGEATTVTGNAVVTGSTTPMQDPVVLPPLVVPSFPSLGNLSISGTSSIGPGNFAYGNLRGAASSTINVIGPAVIVATNFELRSNAKMLIDSTNGPVQIYVIDDFILNSNTVLRPLNYQPEDLEVNLLSDNILDPGVVVQLDDLGFESNAVMYGTILAPEARIEFNSNFELFGAVMAREVHLDSNSRIHFDEDLALAKGGTPGDFTPICWRTVPYK
jgi:hypothetical protein